MTPTADLLRRGLLVLLLFGLAGTMVELLLLRHTEGTWQLAPLVLILLAGAALLAMALSRGRAAIRSLQGVMGLFLVSGVAGTVLHFLGNVTYERESNPSLGGMELYRAALMGATPSLAPGAMIVLGCIGLLYTLRHPHLTAPRAGEDSRSPRITP